MKKLLIIALGMILMISCKKEEMVESSINASYNVFIKFNSPDACVNRFYYINNIKKDNLISDTLTIYPQLNDSLTIGWESLDKDSLCKTKVTNQPNYPTIMVNKSQVSYTKRVGTIAYSYITYRIK